MSVDKGAESSSLVPVSDRVGENSRIVDFLLAGIFLVVGMWFFLPFYYILMSGVPPYAFGHEPIGVRFFQAWVPLRDPGHYPFVVVGFLLDLFHRALLFLLIHLGYSPEKHFVQTMTLFSNVSIFIHAGVMAIVAGVVIRSRALPFSSRILLLVTGASLGYVFYWAPLRLFAPDYPLTLMALAYIFVIFAATVSFSPGSPDGAVVSSAQIFWRRGAPIAALGATMLFLKPSLVPYVLLTFVVGTIGLARRMRWLLIGEAAVTMVAVLAVLWFLLFLNVYGAVSSAMGLVVALVHVGPAEPFFRLKDLVTSGTIYFAPFIGFISWLIISLTALFFPEDRRLRTIPGAVLLGGLFYLYVLTKRPGNAATFEILVYLAVTGTLCIMVLRRPVRLDFLMAWCIILLVQTGLVARTALPQFVSGARYTAEVAQEVDQYARSFASPILYVYPDTGPAPYDIFQSAESAVFKGTLYCIFIPSACGSAYQNRFLSLTLRPYQMFGAAERLPARARFVLIFADVPETPSVTQQNSMLQHALLRAERCRMWTQSRHTIHVCLIRAE